MEQRFLFDFLQKWQRFSAKFGIYRTYDYYVALFAMFRPTRKSRGAPLDQGRIQSFQEKTGEDTKTTG